MSNPSRPSVAVLGAGAMGEALLRGLLSAGWTGDDVSVAVRRPERAEAIEQAVGIRASLDSEETVGDKDVVVVATKPRDVEALLDQIDKVVRHPQVMVSIAAGVRIRSFEERMPGVAVVRAMPNTPAVLGEGVTGIAAGTHADSTAMDSATRVLEAVGVVRRMDESHMDALTAVSGTGPAYVFLLAEAMTEAAVREGLPRDVAEAFVHQTVRGAGHLLTDTGRLPSELRAQVTSPGGTTAAAVHILEDRGFRALIEDAIRAAAIRARELGELER